MLFIEGMEDYVAYESCLTLGLDVDDYAMEAIDFGKMKESISKKINEVKTWIGRKWSDVKAKVTEVIATAIGKIRKNENLTNKNLSKEEKQEIDKMRLHYDSIMKSDDVIDNAVKEYMYLVKSMDDYNQSSEEKQKMARDYVEGQYRASGLFSAFNQFHFDEQLRDIEKEFASRSAIANIQASMMSMQFIETVIKEGNRRLKLADAMVKGPVQKLLAAVTGTMKLSDAHKNNLNLFMQAATAGLNLIGGSVRLIIKIVTMPLQPLIRFIKASKGLKKVSELNDERLEGKGPKLTNAMTWMNKDNMSSGKRMSKRMTGQTIDAEDEDDFL